MHKKMIVFIVFLLSSSWAFSQSEMEALRFSQIVPGGTARYASMGGAFGALGGDFSTLSINPAGLGVYRSSEFTFSPALNFSQADTRYFGTTEEDNKYSFSANNLGVVLSYPASRTSEEGGWQFVNIGIGFNRHSDFNNRWIAEGYNPNNSLMTNFLDRATREGNPENFSDFSTGLAWDTWLLGGSLEEGYFVDMPNGQVLQRQETVTSGAIRELMVSLGANYNDRIFVGATMGFPSVRYTETNRFTEEDSQNRSEVFNALEYKTKLKTTGTGFNLKIGTIVRATDMIRLGVAFHSPTFYELKDTYEASMRSDLNLEYDTKTSSSEGDFDYELNTPLKAIGILGFVFGQLGILSMDYEYVNYTSARLRSSDYSFTQENRNIREQLEAQHVLRLGGEIRLMPLSLRAGYAISTSPYKSGINDGVRSVLSAGFGFRDADYFVDFAYKYGYYSEDYYLYQAENMAPVNRNFSASTFQLTFGWRF